MAILGKVTPSSTNPTVMYTVPTGKQTILNLNVTNTTVNDVNANIYILDKDDLKVSSIDIVNGGVGFTTIPTFEIVGDSDVMATVETTLLSLDTALLDIAGTGYSVGDQLSLEAKTGDTAAIIEINSVDGTGGITDFHFIVRGSYSDTANGLSSTLTGGTGTNAALKNLTYRILEINVTEQGNGYKEQPVINMLTGDGTDFKLDVQMLQANATIRDAIEYEAPLSPKSVLERTGIILNAGETVVVKTSKENGLNFIAIGLEEIG